MKNNGETDKINYSACKYMIGVLAKKYFKALKNHLKTKSCEIDAVHW
jgi:hypothetical protein